MTLPQTSPLGNQMFRLTYPRSLGTYATYAEVQSVVDALADRQFPVQNTMIVGTDLRLVERVTGRRTWGRVIGGGVLSGLWMGLFLGILFSLFSERVLSTVLLSMAMGVVFFAIWSAIGYAASGGRRDFTSMTATIPMQYELLVEHSYADQARALIADAGLGAAVPSPAPASPARPAFGGHASYGQPAVPDTDRSPAPGSMPAAPRPEDDRRA